MFEFPRSTSQRRCWDQCPTKWMYRYGHGYRPTYMNAAQFQGLVYHRVAEMLLKQGRLTPIHPIDYFLWLWESVQNKLEKDTPIRFPKGRDQSLYLRRGQKFWGGDFPAEILQVLSAPAKPLGPNFPPRLVEFRITYPIRPDHPTLSPEVVIPDYVGPAYVPDRIFGKDSGGQSALNVAIDFKTAEYPYDETRAELDEQLTDQQLAVEYLGGRVDAVGLCVMVCQERNPQLQWLWAPKRDAEDIAAFVTNAVLKDEAIKRGQFTRNDQHCHQWGGCEYRPICFKSLRGKMKEELEQTDPRGVRDGISLEEL